MSDSPKLVESKLVASWHSNGPANGEWWSVENGEKRIAIFYAPDAEANARKFVACNQLVAALDNLMADTNRLIEGETCDHPVNICWCGYRYHLRDAEEALKAAKL